MYSTGGGLVLDLGLLHIVLVLYVFKNVRQTETGKGLFCRDAVFIPATEIIVEVEDLVVLLLFDGFALEWPLWHRISESSGWRVVVLPPYPKTQIDRAGEVVDPFGARHELFERRLDAYGSGVKVGINGRVDIEFNPGEAACAETIH